jgi:deoxyribodipyrimidine photo-lyase
MVWPATRAEGLRRLQAFVPRAARAYAAERNHDLGPAARDNVSVLSPYLRHRLITEDEVIAAVLARHSATAAEKFIDEVCWRTYWKGWLEQRSVVWQQYVAEVDRLRGAVPRRQVARAEAGETGIACFDAWAQELAETGYLHNHARMWFASIWVFTLDLPWQLGADFFYRHLLDGDPASNTLSWRWVAGRHTLGKTYLARPDNIARYTNGRFPPAEGLARDATVGDLPPHPPLERLPQRARLTGTGPVAVIVTEDDLSPESWGIDPERVGLVAALAPLTGRPETVATARLTFLRAATADGLARAVGHFAAATPSHTPSDATTIANVIAATGIRQAVTMAAPVGPGRLMQSEVASCLLEHGITLTCLRRDWDDLLWPHATKSFFALKSRIPGALRTLGVGAPQGDLFVTG